ESIAHNLNRKNNELRFFEFGKTYFTKSIGEYREDEHLCLFLTGKTHEDGWKVKGVKLNFYWMKGWVSAILQLLGVSLDEIKATNHPGLEYCLSATHKGERILDMGEVKKSLLDRFDIRQPVFYADLNWDGLLKLNRSLHITVADVPRFPAVHRD